MSDPEKTGEPTQEDKIEALQRDLELLHRELRRNTEEMMGFITILCLPMTDKKRLEVGFSVIKKLPDEILDKIIDRYMKEAIRSDMTFDNIIDPMVRALSFERVWGLVTKDTIRDYFGEWALGRWIEMSKHHSCEGHT